MSLAILSRKDKEKKQTQPKETKQQTALSLVFMFACVLIFHAIVFQPFQIPSGSMAPTLLGNHLRSTCQQCGYTFKLDSHINPQQFRSEPPIICPMCGWPNRLKDAQVSAGDRIIVQKFAYEFTDPKRWDVVVFKTLNTSQTSAASSLAGRSMTSSNAASGCPTRTCASSMATSMCRS